MNKKIIPTHLRIIMILLCIASLACVAVGLIFYAKTGATLSNFVLRLLCFFAYEIAVLFALVYFINGQNKNTPKTFSLFVFSYSVATTISIIISAIVGTKAMYFLLIPLVASLISELVIALDDKISTAEGILLWGICAISAVTYYVVYLIEVGFSLTQGYLLANIVCVVALGVMLLARYKKKNQ